MGKINFPQNRRQTHSGSDRGDNISNNNALNVFETSLYIWALKHKQIQFSTQVKQTYLISEDSLSTSDNSSKSSELPSSSEKDLRTLGCNMSWVILFLASMLRTSSSLRHLSVWKPNSSFKTKAQDSSHLLFPLCSFYTELRHLCCHKICFYITVQKHLGCVLFCSLIRENSTKSP